MTISRGPQPSTPAMDLPKLDLSNSIDSSPTTVVIDPIDILTSHVSTSSISMKERRVSFRDQKETATVHHTATSILFPGKK